MKGDKATMTYENELIRGDDELLALLQRADPGDIHVLVDFLTDKGKGRLALSANVRNALESAKQAQHYTRDELILLIRELQLFGGNTLANLVRRKGVLYPEIVRDVLRHAGGTPADDDIAALELQVLEQLVSKRWAAMNEKERAEFVATYCGSDDSSKRGLDTVLANMRLNAENAARLATAAAAAIGSLFAEGAFAAGATTLLGRAAGIALGPIGIGLGGTAGVYAATKEAYRVTLPCVVQIAYIRQKDAARYTT